MRQDLKHVEFVRALAESYHKKLLTIEEKTRDLDSGEFWNFMRLWGERILDRYREAQTRILRSISAVESEQDMLEELRLMAEDFDEMHLLFFKLLERYYKDAVRFEKERLHKEEDAYGGRQGED